MLPPAHSRIVSVDPLAAVAGGRVCVRGSDIGAGDRLPVITIGGLPARVVSCSSDAVACLVPEESRGGETSIRLDTAPGETVLLEVGVPVATDLHQVDSPAIGRDGTLFLTHSGTRGDSSPATVFRIGPDGFREPFVTGLTNPTSLAIGPDGQLYVSSRFDGTVFRVDDDGDFHQVATDLGVACGLAFDDDGMLYVGDRTGTVFVVSPEGTVAPFATLPPSVAAFHLAMAPGGDLFVSVPTLGTRDVVYRVDSSGEATVAQDGFGRPQGLAVDRQGTLYVVEALAGVSGLHRVSTAGVQQIVAAPSLVGVALGPSGEAVVVSADTAYRFDHLPEPAMTA